jgi:hypothetical protein
MTYLNDELKKQIENMLFLNDEDKYYMIKDILNYYKNNIYKSINRDICYFYWNIIYEDYELIYSTS